MNESHTKDQELWSCR